MSEPVAVIRNSGGNIYISGPNGETFDMSKHVGDSLYTSSEIERKDAAIAELVELLRFCSESLGRFVSDEGWSQLDMDRMDNADSAIAKYDTPREPS